MVRYRTARYTAKQTLKARKGPPTLHARLTSSSWTMRSKNFAISQCPVTTHLPPAAAASALTALLYTGSTAVRPLEAAKNGATFLSSSLSSHCSASDLLALAHHL